MKIYHRHHIIPEHAGGTNDPSNIKMVTIEQHAEEHRLLWEQYHNKKDWIAWKALSGQIGKDEVQRELGRLVGKSNKGRKGRVVLESTKQKIGSANRGRVFSPESRINMSNAHLGYKWSEETLKKRSESRRGFKHSAETIQKMKISAMNRGNNVRNSQ